MAKNYRDNFDYSEAIANSTSKAERDRWARLIGDFFDSERSFNLVVSLVDIRHDPSKLDLQMIEFLRENGFNFIVCLTKADKLSKSQQAKQAASIRKQIGVPTDRLIVTSSESGLGIDKLKQAIVDFCLDVDDDIEEEGAPSC